MASRCLKLHYFFANHFVDRCCNIAVAALPSLVHRHEDLSALPKNIAIQKGYAAIPQEVGGASLRCLCADTNFYDNVPYSEIPGRANGKSQTRMCYHEVHGYCDKIGKGGVGIVQEVTEAVAGVACVPINSYEAVKMTTLQQYHGGPNNPGKGHSADCASAVHNYCAKNGKGQGGVVAELGTDELAVGCAQGIKYIDKQLDYREAEGLA